MKYDAKTKDRIVTLYSSGFSGPQIAKMLGCSKSLVAMTVWRSDIATPDSKGVHNERVRSDEMPAQLSNLFLDHFREYRKSFLP